MAGAASGVHRPYTPGTPPVHRACSTGRYSFVLTVALFWGRFGRVVKDDFGDAADGDGGGFGEMGV